MIFDAGSASQPMPLSPLGPPIRGQAEPRTVLSLRQRRIRLRQVQNPRQIVRRKGEQGLPGQLGQALVPRLAQSTHSFDPAKGFFDQLSPPQAQRVAFAAGRTSVHGATLVLARNMALEHLYEFRHVITLVAGKAGAGLSDATGDHALGRDPLGTAIGLGRLHIHDQAASILGQGMRQITQLGFGVRAFLVQRASGSMRLRCVLLMRVSPLKSAVGLRPPGRPEPSSSLRTKRL